MVEVEGGWSHYPGSGGVFLKAEVCRRNLVTASVLLESYLELSRTL